MPESGRIVVVHDEGQIRELAVTTLRAVGYDVVGFADPMRALDAIEACSGIRLLVTRLNFPAGRPSGASLGRMVRYKRRLKGQSVQVLFVTQPENQLLVGDIGAALPLPLDPQMLVDTVKQLLLAPD